MRLTACIATTLCVALLAGCDDNNLAKVGLRAGWEALVGEPDAEALARSERFDDGGITFDYPAALHLRHSVDDDGDRSWSLEYGMFELELYAPRYESEAADYVGALAMVFEGGRRIDAEAPGPGRTETICGEKRTATRVRVKMMDDWSEIQAFDLPAPEGESRLLIFDDEPIDGKPSAVAQATWDRVLGSLRCALPAKDAPAGQDPA